MTGDQIEHLRAWLHGSLDSAPRLTFGRPPKPALTLEFLIPRGKGFA